MRAVLALSLMVLLAAGASPARALEGAFPVGLSDNSSQAQRSNSCAQTRSQCLQNVGPWTRYPSQRAQCAIRYDQCAGR